CIGAASSFKSQVEKLRCIPLDQSRSEFQCPQPSPLLIISTIDCVTLRSSTPGSHYYSTVHLLSLVLTL
uniref:Uncharacterized protein n=1 Tax=Monopterus albus TaxID=43700 RepID=A0A3Q3JAE4_MONAL